MSDWFSVWTNPNDPTNIVMTRLSDEEAHQAAIEHWTKLIQYYCPELFPPSQPVDGMYASEAERPPQLIDTKADDRRRRRLDLQNKRRDLMKQRGNK